MMVSSPIASTYLVVEPTLGRGRCQSLDEEVKFDGR
jgi:hypothetical protein